jgi:RimJ/RimL family protein N-acetyltransferase
MPAFPIKDKLSDGTLIFIRQICPDDKERLKAGFDKLSPHSNYLRFLTPIGNLSKSQLKYLTEVDQINHIAIGVHDKNLNRIGIARYIKIKDEPDAAEFAIAIIDEHQKKGLGTKLLYLLIESAIENGIQKFIGYVLEENIAMLKIPKKLGATSSWDEENILRTEIDLTSVNNQQDIVQCDQDIFCPITLGKYVKQAIKECYKPNQSHRNHK